MTTPEVRKFTAPVTEKAQTDQGWKVTFNIPDLSKFPYAVNRVPNEDAAKLEVGKTYYISLIKGRAKKEPATKDYDYWWDWGGMAVEVLPENAQAIQPTAPDTARPSTAATDVRADSIERQVALKVAGELYVGAMAAQVDTEATVAEALALARRLVAYFFGDKS